MLIIVSSFQKINYLLIQLFRAPELLREFDDGGHIDVAFNHHHNGRSCGSSTKKPLNSGGCKKSMGSNVVATSKVLRAQRADVYR